MAQNRATVDSFEVRGLHGLAQHLGSQMTSSPASQAAEPFAATRKWLPDIIRPELLTRFPGEGRAASSCGVPTRD
jgi:hypothetical protein